MKRKELKILGLSYSQSQEGSYIVVLSEKNGKRKIPVIVKASDAQQIALKVEGIKPSRPMTHDLFKSMSDAFSLDIQEVYIHSLLEGIFYAKMLVSDGMDGVDIECTMGDALALSLVYDCPIWIKSDILDASGITISDDGTNLEEAEPEYEPRVTSVSDLEHLMNNALANEEYEIAAELRDRISKINEGL